MTLLQLCIYHDMHLQYFCDLQVYDVSDNTSIHQPLFNNATLATLEMWPFVRERCKYIDTSSGKDLWPYYRLCPLSRVATKRVTTLLEYSHCTVTMSIMSIFIPYHVVGYIGVHVIFTGIWRKPTYNEIYIDHVNILILYIVMF